MGLKIDDARRFLLVNAVETYLELAGPEAIEYAHIIAKSPLGEEIQEMEETWADKIEHKGWHKGWRRGIKEGREHGLKAVSA